MKTAGTDFGQRFVSRCARILFC